jgi:zinc transporter ZupT
MGEETTIIIVQSVTIVVLFFMAFISGVLPRSVPWCKNALNVLGIVNAFSGGVFLGTALIYIIPEALEEFEHYLDPDHETNSGGKLSSSVNADHEEPFPVPFVLIFAGYAIVLFIDKVIFDTEELVGGHHHGHTEDPVQTQFLQNARTSLMKSQHAVQGGNTDPVLTRLDSVEEAEREAEMNDNIKNYLSKTDKFAKRMSASLRNDRFSKSNSQTVNIQGIDLDEEQPEDLQSKSSSDLQETVNEREIALVEKQESPKK